MISGLAKLDIDGYIGWVKLHIKTLIESQLKEMNVVYKGIQDPTGKTEEAYKINYYVRHWKCGGCWTSRKREKYLRQGWNAFKSLIKEFFDDDNTEELIQRMLGHI